MLLNMAISGNHRSSRLQSYPIAPALICSSNSTATPLDFDVFPFPNMYKFKVSVEWMKKSHWDVY